MGKNLEVTKYTEKLVPSTRFVAVDNVGPSVPTECFVAPSASVIGNVTIGKHSRYVCSIVLWWWWWWHCIVETYWLLMLR
jgi:hypothetical protein